AQEIFGSDVVVKVVVRDGMAPRSPAPEASQAEPAPRPARRSVTDSAGPVARAVENEPSRRPASSPAPARASKDPDGPVVYYPEEIREKAMRELRGDEYTAYLSSDGKMK